MFGERFLLGPFGFVRVSDAFDSNFGDFQLIGDLLFRHGLFGWYPHFPGGRPSHAFHFSPLHPFPIAAHFVPLWLVYAALKLMLMTAAGYGMFRLGRDYLGFPDWLALAAGLAFACNTQSEGRVVLALFNYVFPLVFVWSLGLGPRPGATWAPAAAGLAFLSVLSYPVLTAPFFATAQVLLLLVLNPVHRAATPRLLLRTVGYWVGYTLACLPVLYALWEYSATAQRGGLAASAEPWGWAVDTAQEVLVNSLLVALIGGAVALAPWSSLVRRALLVNVVPFVLTVFFNTRLAASLHGTFLAKVDLGHILFVQNTLLTILAFVGLRELLARRDLALFYAAGGAVAVAFTFRPLLGRLPYATLLVLNVLVLVVVALLYRARGRLAGAWLGTPRGWAVATLLGLVVAVRVVSFYAGDDVPYRRHFGGAAGRLGLPEGPGRGVVLGFFPSLLQVSGMEMADAYTALYPARYKDVWRLIIGGQLGTLAERERFERYPYELELITGQTKLDFTHRLARLRSCAMVFEPGLGWHTPLLLSLNVTAIVSLRPVRELEGMAERVATTCREPRQGGSPLDQVARYFGPAPVWLYVPRERFERAYVVASAEVLGSDREVLDALGRRSVEDFRRSVLLSAADRPPVRPRPPAAPPGRTTLAGYEPDRLAFEVDTAAPAYLVLSNNHDLHWTATVNGRPAPVLRANHAFQAVAVEATGRSQVVLEWRDPTLWRLYWAPPFGLALLVLVARPAAGPAPSPTPGREATA